MNKKKVGEKYKIIKNTTCHGFSMEDIVTIKKVSWIGDYLASANGYEWYVVDSDLEEVEK